MDGRTADTSGGTCHRLPVLLTKIVYEHNNFDVILQDGGGADSAMLCASVE